MAFCPVTDDGGECGGLVAKHTMARFAHNGDLALWCVSRDGIGDLDRCNRIAVAGDSENRTSDLGELGAEVERAVLAT